MLCYNIHYGNLKPIPHLIYIATLLELTLDWRYSATLPVHRLIEV